jgi:hypothetical protein
MRTILIVLFGILLSMGEYSSSSAHNDQFFGAMLMSFKKMVTPKNNIL